MLISSLNYLCSSLVFHGILCLIFIIGFMAIGDQVINLVVEVKFNLHEAAYICFVIEINDDMCHMNSRFHRIVYLETDLW